MTQQRSHRTVDDVLDAIDHAISEPVDRGYGPTDVVPGADAMRWTPNPPPAPARADVDAATDVLDAAADDLMATYRQFCANPAGHDPHRAHLHVSFRLDEISPEQLRAAFNGDLAGFLTREHDGVHYIAPLGTPEPPGGDPANDPRWIRLGPAATPDRRVREYRPDPDQPQPPHDVRWTYELDPHHQWYRCRATHRTTGAHTEHLVSVLEIQRAPFDLLAVVFTQITRALQPAPRRGYHDTSIPWGVHQTVTPRPWYQDDPPWQALFVGGPWHGTYHRVTPQGGDTWPYAYKVVEPTPITAYDLTDQGPAAHMPLDQHIHTYTHRRYALRWHTPMQWPGLIRTAYVSNTIEPADLDAAIHRAYTRRPYPG